MKTWTLKVNEEELKALIEHHHGISLTTEKYDTERSSRIHDLTKRLNKETPDIETEAKNQNENQQEAASNQTADTWG